MPNSKLPASYKSLLAKVRETLILGHQRIEAQKTLTYWEAGHHIIVEVKRYEDRADYGTQAIKQLAKDLGVEDSTLHRCVQFAAQYTRAQIVAGRRQFSWNHYKSFITISNIKERSLLEDSAQKHQWSAEELAAKIRSGKTGKRTTLDLKEEAPAKQEMLIPKRGTLYTYRIVKRPELGVKGGETRKGEETSPLRLDLGFGMYRRLTPRAAARFSADQIVESDYDTKEETYALKASERTPKELFTYQAVIERVVDADTLKVRIDLGFDLEHRETLRLRDIDAPEVGTKSGDLAKAFVQSLLKEADTIILHTTRSDKYDRYLADVFIGEDTFLNNLLLEKGQAVRV